MDTWAFTTAFVPGVIEFLSIKSNPKNKKVVSDVTFHFKT